MERQRAEVNVYNVESFEAKVKGLNKKAVKAGVSPVTYTIGSEWVKEKVWQKTPWSDGEAVEVVYFYKVAVIEWDEIVYPGGWRLEGVIDHQERLVKSVPESTVSLRSYEERGVVCDHCHTSRDRKETFVLSNEAGEVVQVGRSCLHLFLGVAVERVLSGVGLLSDLGGLEEEQHSGRGVHGYGLESYLANVATVVRFYGWRSRTAAYEGGVTATTDLAWNNLENALNRRKDKQGLPLWDDVSKEDGETAKAVAEWLRGLAARGGLNDYQSNLAQIGQNDFVTHKSSGFAASAIVAYGKEQEYEIKRAAEQAGGLAREYVGVVGGKLTVQATLVKSPGWESQYGYTFAHRFVDEQGHVIIWKTGTALDKGSYTLTATVKAHEEYKSEKQTVITRAKVGLSQKEAAGV